MEQNGNVVVSGQLGSNVTAEETYSPTLSLKGEGGRTGEREKGEGVRRLETMVVRREVLEGLVEEGLDSMLEWLRMKGAPEMVVQYFDSLFVVNSWLYQFTGDEMPAMVNDELPRKVDELKWGIMLFGGEWDRYAGRELRIKNEEITRKRELVFFDVDC